VRPIIPSRPIPRDWACGGQIEKALRDARLDYGQVDYVNLHGTATDTSDRVESLALERALNDHAYRVAVSSTKPVTGHLLAAAGALETAICAFAIQHQEIPMTVNFGNPPRAAIWITCRTSHALTRCGWR